MGVGGIPVVDFSGVDVTSGDDEGVTDVVNADVVLVAGVVGLVGFVGVAVVWGAREVVDGDEVGRAVDIFVVVDVGESVTFGDEGAMDVTEVPSLEAVELTTAEEVAGFWDVFTAAEVSVMLVKRVVEGSS